MRWPHARRKSPQPLMPAILRTIGLTTRKSNMPHTHRTTLTHYLIQQRQRFPTASGNFNSLILDVALACKIIARAVAHGELGTSAATAKPGGDLNVQGETQK